MTIPAYILRRFVAPGGVRLAKRADFTDIAGECPTCHNPVIWKKFQSSRQLEGVDRNGHVYHYGCQPFTRVYPGEDPWCTDQAEKKAILPGNLDVEEYRYWIGFKDRASLYAKCRCCGTEVYGPKDRAKHFRDSDFLIGTNQCTTRLVLAYKQLLDISTSCIVCKKQRFNQQKWGVPLCEQPECINGWKFDTHALYVGLRARLHDQARRALEGLEPEKKKAIVICGVPGRVYCEGCKLYEDNPNHAEIHRAYEMSRNRGCMA